MSTNRGNIVLSKSELFKLVFDRVQYALQITLPEDSIGMELPSYVLEDFEDDIAFFTDYLKRVESKHEHMWIRDYAWVEESKLSSYALPEELEAHSLLLKEPESRYDELCLEGFEKMGYYEFMVHQKSAAKMMLLNAEVQLKQKRAILEEYNQAIKSIEKLPS